MIYHSMVFSYSIGFNFAGMWGAKLIQRRDLIEGLMRALVLAGQNQIGWQDQASLDTIVWPAAKYDVVRLIIHSCNTILSKFFI